jgi:pyroglutamyl-peptidase
MKLLVTGFGPFDRFSQNPSGDLADLVDGERVGRTELHGLRVDVSWRDSWPAVERAVARLRPDGLLAFGLAEGETSIRLETTARNRNGGDPDFFDRRPDAECIAADGPAWVHTGLPAKWMLGELNAPDHRTAREKWQFIPTRLSADAGDYLCNYLFYRIMHDLRGQVPVRGFVHIPPYPPASQNIHYDKSDLLRHAARVVAVVAKWMEMR